MSQRAMPSFYANRCTGCGLCVDVCPEQVLIIEDGLAFFDRPEACTYCGACELVCPTDAVELYYEIRLMPLDRADCDTDCKEEHIND